jgi:signal transduction histidine kinase
MRRLALLLPLMASLFVMLSALVVFGQAQAPQPELRLAWFGQLAALALSGAALALLLARPPAAPPPEAPAATPEEPRPRVAFLGLVPPGGGLQVTEIGPGIEALTGWTPEAALRPGWRQAGIDHRLAAPDAMGLEALAQAGTAALDYRFARPDGGWLWLRETLRVTALTAAGLEVSGTLEDVSAERLLALQAATAAKFATLGEMAAGLAHELNQPIAIMALAAENAAEALEAGADGVEEALSRLRRIMTQADRAKAIVTQLRAFSRVDVATEEPIDLGAAIRGMLVLAGQALRDAEVAVEVQVPPGLPRVIGQPILVEQVLLNLALNARDAMLDQPADQRRLALRVEAGAEEVLLLVIDSGPGLAAEVQTRLFEPFFTTKPPGIGTGLGLSISRTIMQRFGGRIRAENRSGGLTRGAVFTLGFRRAEPAAAPAVTPIIATPA